MNAEIVRINQHEAAAAAAALIRTPRRAAAAVAVVNAVVVVVDDDVCSLTLSRSATSRHTGHASTPAEQCEQNRRERFERLSKNRQQDSSGRATKRKERR